MNADEDKQEIEGEETLASKFDESSEIYPLSSINIDKGGMSLFEIKRRCERGDIILNPDFQRNKVWDKNTKMCGNLLSILPSNVFPNKQLNIFYPQSIVTGRNIQSQCSQIINIGGKSSNKNLWSFKVDNTHKNFTNLHDRYLIIDNKIEIILTSGIDNLIDDSKDFTYIVRRHKQ